MPHVQATAQVPHVQATVAEQIFQLVFNAAAWLCVGVTVVGVVVVTAMILNRRQHSNAYVLIAAFTAINLALLVGTILVVSFNYCNDQNIIADSSFHMQFISTKLLQCKYSIKPECYCLPPALVVVITCLSVQMIETLRLLHFPVMSLALLFGLMQFCGFAGVVLFDSQTVSTKEPREVWHAVSVVLLCFSSWGLHGMTWMFCKNRLMETSKPMGYALESLQAPIFAKICGGAQLKKGGCSEG
jgi:hypothetical protein